MKLIIDIESRYCEDMDSEIKELYYEAISRIKEAIRNGIPYEEKPKYFPPCEDCNKKMEEIRQAYDKMKAMEKPQSEWIDHSEDYGYVECPVCGNLTSCCGDKDELHYCWSCGSKLGKGGAKDGL